MPGIVSEDLPESEGAHATEQFGKASQLHNALRQGGAMAFGDGKPDVQGGPGVTSALPPGAGGPPGPPAQPPAPDPNAIVRNGQVDLKKAFQKPPSQPMAWREQWQALASHPNAGPWIKHMAKMVNARQSQ